MMLRVAAFAFTCTVFAFSGGGESVPHATARGASLGLFATNPAYDYGVMLEEMRSRGASDVLITYRLMQDDIHASRMRLQTGASPSIGTIRRTLRQARRLGLRVGLMPIVGIENRADGEWRGSINLNGEPDVWFERYATVILQAASLAEEAGAVRLIVGSELNGLERFDGEWRSLIQRVRDRFSGVVTYSANWDRYETLAFWDALDEVAVSAYFRMDSTNDAAAQWTTHLARLRGFARAMERPLLLSEVGYPAHADAAEYPWDETRDAPTDLAEQARLLRSFCEAHVPARDGGYYVWNWFGQGGPRDPSYALRGKPAADIFERCMEESDDE
ncbi:MAG: hypothetical protein AB8H86_33590 [Polyangiales bacterium]